MSPDAGTPAEATPAGAEVSIRVLRGHPDPEETAALVTVLLARAAARPSPPPARGGQRWADPAARLRGTVPVGPGPGRWRASAGPAGQ